MVTLKVDGLKFRRCNKWDKTPDPLNQFEVMPIDPCHVRGQLIDAHGEVQVEINSIAKVGYNAAWLPLSKQIGMKIFRKTTGEECHRYFDVMQRAYIAGVAPCPLFCELVEYKGTKKWAIVQQRLNYENNFYQDMHEIYGIKINRVPPDFKEWGDDALPLFTYIKHSGKEINKARMITADIALAIKQALLDCGLTSDFHAGEDDAGDITSFNILWSDGRFWMIDFDSWRIK